MLIESIIKRQGGTLINLGKKAYRFTPKDVDGPHVCEVEDEAHCAVLLAIKEGYRDPNAAPSLPENTVPLGPNNGDETLTGEFVVRVPGEDGDEFIDAEQLDKKGLDALFKRLEIPVPAGSKTKALMLEALVAHLNAAAESGYGA